jgi:hypothetical protein
MRRRSLCIAMVLALMTPRLAVAQSREADEKAIRELIAKLDAGTIRRADHSTAQSIFWSGAYKGPVIGRRVAPQPIDNPGVTNRVQGSQRSKTTVRRIDIAQAGDMAYEFSDVELTWDMKTANGVQRSNADFMTSVLRVWKKVEGRWLVDAHVSFAHDMAAALEAGRNNNLK